MDIGSKTFSGGGEVRAFSDFHCLQIQSPSPGLGWGGGFTLTGALHVCQI